MPELQEQAGELFVPADFVVEKLVVSVQVVLEAAELFVLAVETLVADRIEPAVVHMLAAALHLPVEDRNILLRAVHTLH